MEHAGERAGRGDFSQSESRKAVERKGKWACNVFLQVQRLGQDLLIVFI